MKKHNPSNERIKREYFEFLKEAKQHSEPTVDAVAKALSRFESHFGYRDFKSFRHEQATAFKRHLSENQSIATGERLSQATRYATLAHLKRFFQWLALQRGYKGRLRYSEAEYFNLSDKDSRVATARRERAFPTLEQVRLVIAAMPSNTEIERRNRALIAFTLLTGARDSAIASMKLKHINLDAGLVDQDARDVKTKNSKSFTSYFFPVGIEVLQPVVEWVSYLRTEKQWGDEDPLFPATHMGLNDARHFHAVGVERQAWSSAEPIRRIFSESFRAAGLPYFNPHSLRRTLVAFGETRCQTPEDFKAWSQNLGHEGVLTTFCSYGAVAPRRQGEIIRELDRPRIGSTSNVKGLAQVIERAILNAARGNGAED